MNKIGDLAWREQLDTASDARLHERTRCLSFISPAALEIDPALCNDVVLSIAEEELRRMNRSTAPGDKLGCIMRSCQIIMSVLNLSRSTDGSGPAKRPGADDFLPMFILVVLRANVPHLHTNLEYIQAYHNPIALMSKAGYCCVNLQSASEFILSLDATSLSMDADEFNACLAQGERALAEERAELMAGTE